MSLTDAEVRRLADVAREAYRTAVAVPPETLWETVVRAVLADAEPAIRTRVLAEAADAREKLRRRGYSEERIAGLLGFAQRAYGLEGRR